jgi:hypothetical protein
MVQVVNHLTESFQSNPKYDRYQEETMVRKFVDPIDEGRSIVSQTGELIRKHLSPLIDKILRELADS